MKTSQRGIDLIKGFEGCKLKAYRLSYKGHTEEHYTIGYGHYGADVKLDMVLTQQEAEELLKKDLARFEQKVMIYNPVYHWTQNEFDALVSYAYNIGSIKGLVADGSRSREEIIADWANHDRAGGVHLPGLKKRRLAELALFTEGKDNKMSISEKGILLCGHGSGTPSVKNMRDYLEGRYQQTASNGKRKGLVKVMRLKAMDDVGRDRFHDAYRGILGRNVYSQSKRSYVFEPYKDGKYYSDCSSSGMAAMQQAGYSVSLLNTAGIYKSMLFSEIPVQISAGHVKNPELLKVGDALLFVGNDPSRPLQIGHVEYVYEISEGGENAKYVLGWHKDEKGWWYTDTPESYYQNCWQVINHHWYYFDSEGYILTGYQTVNGEPYFFMPEGDLEGACCRTDERGVIAPWEV